MIIKKILILMLALVGMITLYACSEAVTNTEENENSAVVTDPSTTTVVSIPTDSSLADSVFDDASNPTKTNSGNASEVKETDENVESTDSKDNTDPVTDSTAPDTAPEEMTYEDFAALTPEEQRLYQESFKDLDAFFEWYTAAKEKYEEENPPIEIDGPIDLGKY